MKPSAGPPEAATPGVFVTGSGTEVGKTFVASAIARTLSRQGERVAVFKPAVSGLDEPAAGIPPDHELLRLAAASDQTDDEIAPYRYGPAVSPHLAAELEGEEISRDRLLEAFASASASADRIVCEGVGGFLVPLRLDYLIRDLAVDLGLPVVIAAAPGLGTINHTALTVESVRAAGLEVAAVVITPWPESPAPIEESNRDSIAAVTGARVLTLAAMDPAAPDGWPELLL